MANSADEVFSALADPGRRAMLERLARGSATVSELGEPLDMSLSAVLQHVTVLEAAGLVTTAKQGRTRVVSPAPGGLDPARSWIVDHEQAWHRRGTGSVSALDVLFGGPSGLPSQEAEPHAPTAPP